MKTFKHSGDLGDIIFSLPTIKALGGGILYLDPQGGLNEPLVTWGNGRYNQTRLNEQSIYNIKPLLELQPYIERIELLKPGIKVDYNLDRFRQHIGQACITKAHLDAFGQSAIWMKDPWLFLDTTRSYDVPARDILVVRTFRMHGNQAFWEMYPDEYIKRSVFVGAPKEYEIFNETFSFDIPFWDLKGILALAEAINGCSLFVSNQTLGHAIAEGFKKNLIQEVYRIAPISVFQREGAIYV